MVIDLESSPMLELTDKEKIDIVANLANGTIQ